jgi:hypothetical protein
MASSSGKNIGRGRLLHVGFMVPLNELMFENEALQRELGHLNLRCNVYSAVLFYRDTNQDALHGWFDQRKRSSRNGYLRALFTNKKGDAIIEMDVDGKQFYLIASSHSSKSPIQLKREIAGGMFGERKPFAERIQVSCFAYKCDETAGFVECEAFITFKAEQEQKRQALQAKAEENSVAC